VFQGYAGFGSAVFQGYAGFGSAGFQGDAGFGFAEFWGGAYFRSGEFQDYVSFWSVRFGGGACVNTDGESVLCRTDFSDRLFTGDTPTEPGLRAAASNELYGSTSSQAGSLVAGQVIDIGTNESGQTCQLVNDTDHDVPIPDLPLVCS
jgi:hypothetical protein